MDTLPESVKDNLFTWWTEGPIEEAEAVTEEFYQVTVLCKSALSSQLVGTFGTERAAMELRDNLQRIFRDGNDFEAIMEKRSC